MLFSYCKGETHTHKTGFKQLYRRLRSMYRPEKLDSTEDLCLEVLLGPGSSSLNSSMAAVGSGTLPTILVLGCPTQPFTAHEFDTLRAFLRGGGSMLVCLSEGGEQQAGTNLNYLLEELGISANADAVVRTAHYKYLHPKEALISDGVLNRALLSSSSSKGAGAGSRDIAEGLNASGPGADADAAGHGVGSSGKGLDFVYPFGCTLSVQPPAVPILSSGKISYPMQRPLGECFCNHHVYLHTVLLLTCNGSRNQHRMHCCKCQCTQLYHSRSCITTHTSMQYVLLLSRLGAANHA